MYFKVTGVKIDQEIAIRLILKQMLKLEASAKINKQEMSC